MPEPIIYVDRSEVRAGKLDDLKLAMAELVDLVEANEPRLIAYNVYFSEDGTQMTVVHVHADEASLEFHMSVVAAELAKFVEFITLLTIDVYGRMSNDLRERIRHKARLLGSGTLLQHRLHAGVDRFSAP